MSVDGLIPWLVQGPFPIFALIIGFVVSIDVAVVEIMRNYDEESRDGKSRLWTRRMQCMTLLHATLHSLSFLVYMMLIYWAQYLAFWPIEFFYLSEDLGLGLLTLINFFVVAFIWWTYRNKVKEDHSEKSDDSGTVDRKDMKFLVDLVRMFSHKYGYGDKVRGVAVAGSVAIDMLAVSALLKEVLLPRGGEAPIASMYGCLPLDLILFAVIIFAVVALVVILAQMLGTMAREFHWLVVLLRMFEPFAVFFILAGVARLVAHLSFESLPTVYIAYGNEIDALFSVVVTISLFWFNGIGLTRLMKLYAKRSWDSMSTNPPIILRETLKEWKGFSPTTWIVLFMFCVIFVCMLCAYKMDPGREIHNHLVKATEYIAVVVFIGTIIVLYTPLKRLDDWETNQTASFHEMFRATPKDFFNRLGAVTLALAAHNIHTCLVLGQTIASESILLWSGYIFLGWLLFDLRRWRLYRSDSAGGTHRADGADYAELLTAVGLASAAVALVVPFIVRQIIG